MISCVRDIILLRDINRGGGVSHCYDLNYFQIFSTFNLLQTA